MLEETAVLVSYKLTSSSRKSDKIYVNIYDFQRDHQSYHCELIDYVRNYGVMC